MKALSLFNVFLAAGFAGVYLVCHNPGAVLAFVFCVIAWGIAEAA